MQDNCLARNPGPEALVFHPPCAMVIPNLQPVSANTMNSALEYQQNTAFERNRTMGRRINWNDQPIPFKLYRGVPKYNLPQELSLPDTPLDRCLELPGFNPEADMPRLLASVCYLTAGLTRVRRQADGLTFHFRTMPSAGALYPTELYVALQNVNGMNDGLYHYSPLEHTLTPLRQGLVFSALAGSKPVIRFYLTSVFHRSAWKYGPRAYRYCLLDAGHMAENLLLAARVHGLPATADYDFDDDFLNEFLCLDPGLEACVTQVHGYGCGPSTAVYDTVPPVSDTLPEFCRSAKNAEAPQEVLDVHRLCAARPPGKLPVVPPPSPAANRLPEPELPASITAAMEKRKSSRNFVVRDINPRLLTDVLGWVCLGQPENPLVGTVQTGVLANTHSGLTPGLHHLDPRTRSLSLTQPGNFMARSAQVCLDQEWLENAALHLTFSADLARLESLTGPRAFRYAHLEAGRLGQRAYLAATANNLGACGIGAFFDHEAAELLGLEQGNHLLYLMAVGPVK